jgi:hypothetical protein
VYISKPLLSGASGNHKSLRNDCTSSIGTKPIANPRVCWSGTPVARAQIHRYELLHALKVSAGLQRRRNGGRRKNRPTRRRRFIKKPKKKGLRRSDAKAPRTSEPRIAVK